MRRGKEQQGNIHFDRACGYKEKNEYSSAIRELKKALKHKYAPGLVHRDMGVIYGKLGRSGRAMREYDKALKHDGKNGQIHALKGHIYRDRGDEAAAEKEYEKALEKGYDTADVRLDLAKICKMRGMAEKAAVHLKEVLRVNPGSWRAHAELGRIFESRKDLSGAEEEFSAATRISGCGGEVYFELAGVYRQKKDPVTAMENYRKALLKKFDEVYVREDLAKACDLAGETAQAIAEYLRAAEMDPARPGPHLELARIYERSGEYGAAEAEFRKAVELDPGNKRYRMELGSFYEKTADKKAAERMYEESLVTAGEDDALRLKLGVLYRERGEFTLSARQFERVIDHMPGNGSPRFRNMVLNEKEISMKKEVMESFPRYLAVCLTNRCNIRCTMCNVWQRQWSIPENTVGGIKRFMPYLQKISWQGGEVFYSPYFRELFEEAAKYDGLEQVIGTNGLMIDKEWAESIGRAGASLNVSIDGVTKSTYEHVHEGAKFEDLLSNLELINRYRVADADKRIRGMGLQLVVMKENYGDLKSLAGFIGKYGFSSLRLLPLWNISGAENDLYSDPGVRKEVVKLVMRLRGEGVHVFCGLPIEIPAGRENQSGPASPREDVGVGSASRCLLPWQQLNICCSGDVIIHCFCPTLKVGNVKDSSLEEIWNGAAIRDVRKKMSENAYHDGCHPSCVAGIISRGELQWECRII
ncbi:MAG: tetratricopeptide repeat protein [Elusimicrobia bacterium]|nr:tetratricopeptide repeat protein [Elusimicrobiota bacterium]